MSGGYFPASFKLNTLNELSYMFIFLGCGFVALCVVFVFLYRYAIRRRVELRLNDFELYESATSAVVWAGSAGIGVISIVLALTLPDQLMPYAGFAYFLIAAWIPLCILLRQRRQPEDRSL